MEWIITAKPTGKKGYKIIEAIEELEYIDWHKSKVLKNIETGDIVYIYVGKPYMKIMFKMTCLQSVVTSDEIVDDIKYYNDPEQWETPEECFRLKKIKETSTDKLSLYNLLKLKYIKGNIQGSFKSDNFPELFEYINSQFSGGTIEEDSDLESNVVIYTTEGKKIEYFTTKYERNITNRKEAIRLHGTSCQACGFNFLEVYGALGKDFIEVHHIKPLYSLDQEVEINPKDDLACLCSNCHKMIHHKKNTILTVDELKRIVLKHMNK